MKDLHTRKSRTHLNFEKAAEAVFHIWSTIPNKACGASPSRTKKNGGNSFFSFLISFRSSLSGSPLLYSVLVAELLFHDLHGLASKVRKLHKLYSYFSSACTWHFHRTFPGLVFLDFWNVQELRGGESEWSLKEVKETWNSRIWKWPKVPIKCFVSHRPTDPIFWKSKKKFQTCLLFEKRVFK